MAAPKPDDLLSSYDAIALKGTTLITLEKAVKDGKIEPAQTIKVGKSRTMDMFTRKALDAWEPRRRDSSAGIKKAADLLGILFEDAKALHETKGAKPRHVTVTK